MLIINARETCEQLGIESPHIFTLFCTLLDSARFVSREGLEYHHRTGAWGTDKATYTFHLAREQTEGGRRFLGPLEFIVLGLGLAVVCVLAVIFGVLTGVLPGGN